MSPEHSSPLSTIGRPGRPFWTTLGFALTLLLFWLILIEGAVLVAAIVLPFVFLVALGVWVGTRLLNQSDAPFRSGPLAVAGVLSALVFLYSLLVEGAVLLGLVACFLVLGAGTALGLVLAQDTTPQHSHSRSRAAVESEFQRGDRTSDRSTNRPSDRDPERTR